MRFTTFFVSGAMVAAAMAADTTSSADAAASSVEACVKKCGPTDLNCQAHCIAVPSPNQSQIEATTNCVANCPQGKGTPEDNKAFGECRDKCIQESYYKTSVGTPEPTGSSGDDGDSSDSSDSSSSDTTVVAPGTTQSSGSDSGSASTTMDSGSSSPTTSAGSGGSSTTSSGGSATNTSSSASSSPTNNGASGLVVSSMALFGAMAAVLAL